MSYDGVLAVLAGVCVFFGVATPLLCVRCFKAGYGMRTGVRERPATLPRLFGSPGPSEDERRLSAVLANIDAYDGTGMGQREVE